MADVPVKETKAQRMERLKREKNPWEIFDEVRAFAREGRASVVPEWAGAYFKWWGIYTQGDGIGAVGGKGGEGLASEYFMMRIAMPNGIIDSHQLRVISDITKTHARNLADITTRQNIQLHWLTIESIPEIVDALDKINLSPKGACGDVVRNVTGCPLAGIDHEEILDASPLALELAKELIANPEFYNLPRKFKICATGCPVWCSYPEINDIAFTGARRGEEVGYTIRVGGGLSKEPHLAVKLDAFVRPDQAVAVAKEIARIFKDQQGLRENRDKARLKYLFLKENWTAESFLEELERRLGYKLDSAPEENIPDEVLRDHTGVHPQKQDGLYSVGATVLRGRLSGDQLASLADLADKYGDGQLRATIGQNILLVNIPKANISALVEDLGTIGLRVEGSSFWRGTVACTGTEFCKLAISETKGFARWVVDELEERMPSFDQQLKLHVTGCPNGCGQHWIADIGLEGKKVKHEGQMVDAFNFVVGGAVGKYSAVARPIAYRAPATEVPAAIERLLSSYLQERNPDESLRAYFSRHDAEAIRVRLAGEVLAAAPAGD
ncbi:nitrite/sulfite reductase [Silvibacterium acidisoli]|uniref:nitrite/sulfite reductase n=1 Tax=Acidobacteriaceae bacterium ZG23-2 TaxID=2883246 RepID=UPI00406C9F90